MRRVHLIPLLILSLDSATAWSSPTPLQRRATRLEAQNSNKLHPTHIAASVALGSLLAWTPLPSQAAIVDDMAGDTVDTVLRSLKSASGNTQQTVQVYEEIAAIITEGKGVGGNINYKGVQLDRGYVADEDTSIYNPGLTLLTESEKNQLVASLVESRKAGLASNQWNVDTQAGFDFLREKLDPLHMYELKGYLSIVPYYGAALYLAVLAVQNLARDLFPVAYLVSVAAFFGPILLLVAIGPQ